MDFDLFFRRQKVIDKQLIVQYLPAGLQMEDALSKPSSTSQIACLKVVLAI